MDVQAADALTSRGGTRVLDEIAVTLDGRDLLLGREARRIRACRCNSVSIAFRDVARRASQLDQTLERLIGRVADIGRQFDDRCMKLGLERAGKAASLRAGDERLDRGHELQRLRIDNPELLLDADGQGAPELLLDHLALTPCTGPPAASHA